MPSQPFRLSRRCFLPRSSPWQGRKVCTLSELPLVNQSVAPYSRSKSLPFNFQVKVINSVSMLSGLGVNIFANTYNTWIFHTIYQRLVNNARRRRPLCGRHLVVLHDLYSFFNHSCMPKVLKNGSAKSTGKEKPGTPKMRPGTGRLTARAKIVLSGRLSESDGGGVRVRKR